jgi:osmotically inducible protein OsmC
MSISKASARWEGSLKEGKGVMKPANAGDVSFSLGTRFEGQKGSNPEELIGAALAGCFTMQVSHMLSEAGHVPDSVETQAKVQIRNVDGNPTISQIDLVTTARVPGVDDNTFQETAKAAKDGCIISRALAGVGNITLDATLES